MTDPQWNQAPTPPPGNYTPANYPTAPNRPPGSISPKSRLAALLLAIFLGGFGVHSFYVGKVGVGIAQLAITIVTLGTLGWIWPLIDVIFIAVGTYKDSAGRLVYDWEK